jgi:hypothetical protein
LAGQGGRLWGVGVQQDGLWCAVLTWRVYVYLYVDSGLGVNVRCSVHTEWGVARQGAKKPLHGSVFVVECGTAFVPKASWRACQVLLMYNIHDCYLACDVTLDLRCWGMSVVAAPGLLLPPWLGCHPLAGCPSCMRWLLGDGLRCMHTSR